MDNDPMAKFHEELHTNRHQRIDFAVRMTAPLRSGTGATHDEAVRRHYAISECPAEGHTTNPAGSCVYCGEHFEDHEVPVYRDRVRVAMPTGVIEI